MWDVLMQEGQVHFTKSMSSLGKNIINQPLKNISEVTLEFPVFGHFDRWGEKINIKSCHILFLPFNFLNYNNDTFSRRAEINSITIHVYLSIDAWCHREENG